MATSMRRLAPLGISLLLTTACTIETMQPAAPAPAGPPTLEEAERFIDEADKTLRDKTVASSRATWIQENFINDDTEAQAAAADEELMGYLTTTVKASRRFDGLKLSADLARKMKLLRLAASLPAPDDAKERKELAEIASWMSGEYGKGKYCKGTQCRSLGDLSTVMSESRDWNTLLDAWQGWHAISKPIRPKFQRYVELANKGAREIGFEDLGAKWRSGYDMSAADFEADTDRLWGEVKPLYDDLHCYVRKELRKKYGADKIGVKAPIPAHILGNMWAQEWNNLYPDLTPYKDEPPLDVNEAIKAKVKSAQDMVKIGESFFTSMGFDALPKTFWERSLFVKPQDREVVCHASAWDVNANNDLRIKMCIEKKEEDLVTIHHELGHDYYYHQYVSLPFLYSDAPNDGFHEGIGDAIALAITPGYMKRLGFLDKIPDNPRGETNFLMKQALERVAFLPFGLLIDKWRWMVFSGKVAPADYNKAWWELRRKYQGVDAPVARTEADFDPGAKYHVPANTPYMRYFLARIYQFQFYRALCKAAGHKGPLHQCSFFGSKAAGDRFKAMLSLGASKPWQEAMKELSGESRGDASAILEYFAPLHAWLKEQNKGETCGY